MELSLNDYMSEKGINKWFSQLNAAPAPIPRQNVRTTLGFFRQQMPTLPPKMALNFLLAMDLSRLVKSLVLPPDVQLIAFRVGNESPFKLFYTRPGASPYRSGINPAGRSALRFRTRVATPALESYTTGAIDVWTIPAEGQTLTVAPRANSTGYMASGGGIQLLIPRSYDYLEVKV